MGEDKKAETRKAKLIEFKEKFALALFSLIIWGTFLVLFFGVYVTLSLTEMSVIKSFLVSAFTLLLLFLFFHLIIILLNIYRLLGHLMEFNFILDKKKNKTKK